MRRLLAACVAMVLAAATAGNRAGADPKLPQTYRKTPPPEFVPYWRPEPAEQRAPQADQHAPRRNIRLHVSASWAPGFGHYPYDSRHYGYDPYDNPYSYPYPYLPYYHEPYRVAPFFLPAETLYGLQPPGRFMGTAPWWGRPRTNVIIIAPPGKNIAPPAKNIVPPGKNNERADDRKRQKPNLRSTNERSRELARKFIGYGDVHFNNQRYSDAQQRYRKAIRAAPQLAEGHFRQGYALVATGRYELAAKALKRALALEPARPRSDFRNSQLYGDNRMAKNAHLDALAAAAEKDPANGDLLFLLGVYLHFDGQPDRAAVFFRRAAQLSRGNDEHLKGFVGNDE